MIENGPFHETKPTSSSSKTISMGAKLRVMVIFGTMPEVEKIAPVIKALRKLLEKIKVKVFVGMQPILTWDWSTSVLLNRQSNPRSKPFTGSSSAHLQYSSPSQLRADTHLKRFSPSLITFSCLHSRLFHSSDLLKPVYNHAH